MLKSPIPLSENRVKNLRRNAKRNSKKSSKKLKDELNLIAIAEGFVSWAALLKTHDNEKGFNVGFKNIDQDDRCRVAWGHTLGVAYRKLKIKPQVNVIQIAVFEDKDPICCDDYIDDWKFIVDLPLEFHLRRSDPYYSRIDIEDGLNLIFDYDWAGVYRVLDIDTDNEKAIIKHLRDKFYHHIHNAIFDLWINGVRVGLDDTGYWIPCKFTDEEEYTTAVPDDKLPDSACRSIASRPKIKKPNGGV